MGPVEAIKTCLRKSFRFSGCASRSETWWFALLLAAILLLFLLGANLVHLRLPGGLLELILLSVLAPYLSALARRMHDLGKPGYLAVFLLASPILLGILAMILSGDGFVGAGIMVVGIYALPIILAIVMSLPSQPGPNQYGPNPLEVTP